MKARHQSASDIGVPAKKSARLVARLVAPRTIRHRLTQILLVSLALVLALLGVTIVGQFADYSAAHNTQSCFARVDRAGHST